MSNKVRVDILGNAYTINTLDSEEYVEKLALKLEHDVEAVLARNPNLPVARAAVFIALNYLDDYMKSAHNADSMRTQIKEYLEDAAKAKSSADDARREVERLISEVAYLKERRRG